MHELGSEDEMPVSCCCIHCFGTVNGPLTSSDESEESALHGYVFAPPSETNFRPAQLIALRSACSLFRSAHCILVPLLILQVHFHHHGSDFGFAPLGAYQE